MESEVLRTESFEYVMLLLYPKEVVMHYANGPELALSYLFHEHEDAMTGYNYCVELVEKLSSLADDEREAMHKTWVKMQMVQLGGWLVQY